MNGSAEPTTILSNGHAVASDLIENIFDQANEQIISKNEQKKIESNNHITSDDSINDENNHQPHHHHHKKKDIDRSVKVYTKQLYSRSIL